MRGIAQRRHEAAKAKARTIRVARHVWGWGDDLVTPKRVGKLASVHCRACTCCGAKGTRLMAGDTIQQRKAADDARHQLAEL